MAGSCCCPARSSLAAGESYVAPVALRRVRPRPGRGGPPLPPLSPVAPAAPERRPAGDAQRLGGRLLRPRPGPADRSRRAGRRPRRRALRARRRLVRGASQRPGRPRRLDRLRRRLADGLHPLVDKVTELGMEFGLWFEPEMVNLDSDVARAHPEWIMATGGRLPVESRSQQVINLGIPECYAYIRDAIFAILDEYAIGYIKWDHNRDLIDAGTAPERPGGCARADARLLPAGRRAQGRPPGSGDRVVLLGRRAGRPRRARAHRPGLGLGLHRPAGAPADEPVDHPADPAGADGLAHRLGPFAHHRAGSTTSAFRAATAVFGHLGIEWDLRRPAPTS